MQVHTLLFASLISIVGCASIPTPLQAKHIDTATPHDCLKVYDHLVSLTVDRDVDTEHTFNATQRWAANVLTDRAFIDSGVAAGFFTACNNKLTTAQADCMLASTTTDVSLCVKLVR